MIPEDFYNRKHIEKQYFNGEVSHFGAKRPGTVALKSHAYTLQQGETLMDVAEAMFPGNSDMFTMLMEINAMKHPDEWKPGDSIQIPEQVAVQSYALPDTTPVTPAPKWQERSALTLVNEAQTCEAVTGLELTATAKSITADWALNNNATHYIYQYKKTVDVDWTEAEIAFGTSITIENLEEGVEYQVRVQAVCRFGGSSNFVTDAITTGTYPVCDVLGNITVVQVKDTSIKITFADEHPGDHSLQFEIEYYRVTVPEEKFTKFSTVNETELVNLIAGETYAIRARRICKYLGEDYEGEWTPEKLQNLFPACGIVTNLQIANRNATEITLEWDAFINASDQIIEVRKVGDDAVLQTLHTLANVVTVTNLPVDTDIEFAFTTICDTLQSPVKRITARTTAIECPLPQFILIKELEGLEETPLKRQIRVQAAANANVQEYHYFLNGNLIVSSSNSTEILTLADAAWSMETVTVGIQYKCAADSVSPVAAQELVLTQPNPAEHICLAPVVTVDNATAGSFDVTVANGDDNTTSILFEYRPAFMADDAWEEIEIPVGKTTIDDLLASTAYLWRVKAVCTFDSEEVESDYRTGSINTIAGDVETTACPIVGLLHVMDVGETEARAEWTAPTENLSNVTGYQVRLTRTSDLEVLSTTDKAANELTHTWNDLITDTEYFVEVRSKCGDNFSEWSGAIGFTTTIVGTGGGGGGDV